MKIFCPLNEHDIDPKECQPTRHKICLNCQHLTKSQTKPKSKATNPKKPEPTQTAKVKPTTATTRPTRTPKSDRGGAYRLEPLRAKDFKELEASLKLKVLSVSQIEQMEREDRDLFKTFNIGERTVKIPQMSRTEFKDFKARNIHRHLKDGKDKRQSERDLFDIDPVNRVSLKEQLEDINRHFWAERHQFENSPRPSKIRKTLGRILELALYVEKWTRIFEGLDTQTEDMLFNAGYRSGRYQGLPARLLKGDLENLTPEQSKAAAENIIRREQLDLIRALSRATVKQADLNHIFKAAEEAHSWLTDKGGPTRRRPIEYLILRLAAFYEDSTRKKAKIPKDPNSAKYIGEFFRFARTFFDILDRKTNDGTIPRTNSAIGNLITNTFKEFRPRKKE